MLALAISYLMNLKEDQDTPREKFVSEISSENGDSRTDIEVNKFEDNIVCVPSVNVHHNNGQAQVTAKKLQLGWCALGS